MFYTVYKTTNIINGKIYVGCHKTENPNDNYLGSGSVLPTAIRKYGRQAFSKEVLFVFDNPEDMRAKEQEIVTGDFVNRSDTYNLMRGGDKGFGSMDENEVRVISAKGHEAQRRLAFEDPSFRDCQRESGRRTFRWLNAKASPSDRATFTGRKHSQDSRKKISKSMRGKNSGTFNSQYGTKWVCREGSLPRKISQEDLPEYLANGWLPGRKSNPH